MKRPSMRQRRLVILSLALVAFGVAYYGGSRYKDRPQAVPEIAGVAIHPPIPLPDVQDMGGTGPIQQALLVDRWSLLMLDPKTSRNRSPALHRLLQVHNRLAADPPLQQRIAFLYLPLELDAATAGAIGELGENFHALTGDAEQVEETFRRFGIEPGDDAMALYLIGPQVRLHALFTPDQDIATIAEDLATLIIREP